MAPDFSLTRCRDRPENPSDKDWELILMERKIAGHSTIPKPAECRRVRHGCGGGSIVQSFCQHEIQDIHLSVTIDLQIGRFDFAMNYALLLGCFERFADVSGRGDNILDGQKTTLHRQAPIGVIPRDNDDVIAAMTPLP